MKMKPLCTTIFAFSYLSTSATNSARSVAEAFFARSLAACCFCFVSSSDWDGGFGAVSAFLVRGASLLPLPRSDFFSVAALPLSVFWEPPQATSTKEAAISLLVMEVFIWMVFFIFVCCMIYWSSRDWTSVRSLATDE